MEDKIENKYQNIIKDVEEFLKLSEDNLIDRSLKVYEFRERIYKVYLFYILRYSEKEIETNKKKGQLIKHYKFNDDYKWNTKEEIISQLESNDDYCKLIRIKNVYEFKTKHLQDILKQLSNFYYHIKNLIDVMKFKQGIY